jgi:hypothetical protein
MKKLIVVATLLVVSVLPVRAETVRTCSSVYGGGEVCGENTTSTTVTHTVVETGAGDNQMFNMIMGLAGAALAATVLYKITYKSYLLG